MAGSRALSTLPAFVVSGAGVKFSSAAAVLLAAQKRDTHAVARSGKRARRWLIDVSFLYRCVFSFSPFYFSHFKVSKIHVRFKAYSAAALENAFSKILKEGIMDECSRHEV